MTSFTSPAPVAPRPTPIDEPVEQGNSLWHDAWLRLRKNKLATFGLASLAVIAFAWPNSPRLLRSNAMNAPTQANSSTSTLRSSPASNAPVIASLATASAIMSAALAGNISTSPSTTTAVSPSPNSSPMKPLTALWPSSTPPSLSSRTMAFKPSAFTPITAPVIALALCAIPWPPSASNIASPAPIPLRPMARPSALSKLPCASGLMLTPPPISAQIASRLSFTTTTGIVLITPSNSALPSPDSPST